MGESVQSRTTIGQFALFTGLQNELQVKLHFSYKNEWATQLENVGQIYFLQNDFHEAQKICAIVFLLPCNYRPLYCSSWRFCFIHSWKDTVQPFFLPEHLFKFYAVYSYSTNFLHFRKSRLVVEIPRPSLKFRRKANQITHQLRNRVENDRLTTIPSSW